MCVGAPIFPVDKRSHSPGRVQSAGENKRILRIIKEHYAKLQVFVWAPLNYPVTQDEDDFSASSESGFSIASCTEDEVYSFDKTERYALAMFEAVPAMRMFISFRKGPCYVWPHGAPLAEPRVIRVYDAPVSLPVSRSAKTFQDP